MNYIEIYVVNEDDILQHKSSSVYNVGLSKDRFYRILEKYRKKQFILKEYKEFRYLDIICQKFVDNTVKVFRDCLKEVEHSSKYLKLSNKRDVLTLLQFPSTNNIVYQRYVKKTTFKINNRIYLNFEISVEESDSKTYSIYINYNIDSNNTNKENDLIINQLLDTICGM